jgi:hypothetical protein
MPPLGPYIVDGKSYYTIAQASQTIGPVIGAPTLWYWAARRACTPWGLELDVKRVPVIKHGKEPARIRRNSRLLISEESTLLLKRLLNEYRRNPRRPMRLTNDELSDLRAATQKFLPK